MSTQIAVRLPDDLVAYLDEVAGDEPGTTRAAVVRRALERDRRARQTERDVAILRASGDYGDFDDLAAHARDHAVPLD